MEREEPLTLDEAFEMSMELWDVMSRLEDTKDVNLAIKGMVLTEVLEYDDCTSDCPFCEYTNPPMNGCNQCPISVHNDGWGCGETPYSVWSDNVFFNNEHSKEEAKDFFDFLCMIYEEHYNRPYEKV